MNSKWIGSQTVEKKNIKPFFRELYALLEKYGVQMPLGLDRMTLNVQRAKPYQASACRVRMEWSSHQDKVDMFRSQAVAIDKL